MIQSEVFFFVYKIIYLSTTAQVSKENVMHIYDDSLAHRVNAVCVYL